MYSRSFLKLPNAVSEKKLKCLIYEGTFLENIYLIDEIGSPGKSYVYDEQVGNHVLEIKTDPLGKWYVFDEQTSKKIHLESQKKVAPEKKEQIVEKSVSVASSDF